MNYIYVPNSGRAFIVYSHQMALCKLAESTGMGKLHIDTKIGRLIYGIS